MLFTLYTKSSMAPKRNQRLEISGVVALIDKDPDATIKVDDEGRFYEIPESMAVAFEQNADQVPLLFEHSSELPEKNAKSQDRVPLKALGKVKRFYIDKANNRKVLKMDATIDNQGFITAVQRMSFDFNKLHKKKKYKSSDGFIRGGEPDGSIDVTGKSALLGRYPGLSISHMMSDLNKPKEVSVCSTGARQGTLITDVKYFGDGGVGQDPSVDESEIQPYTRMFNSLHVSGLNYRKGQKIQKDAEIIGMDPKEVMSFTLQPDEGGTLQPDEGGAVEHGEERTEEAMMEDDSQPTAPVKPSVKTALVEVEPSVKTAPVEVEPSVKTPTTEVKTKQTKVIAELPLKAISPKKQISTPPSQDEIFIDKLNKEIMAANMQATFNDFLEKFSQGQAEIKKMIAGELKRDAEQQQQQPARPRSSRYYDEEVDEPRGHYQSRDRSPRRQRQFREEMEPVSRKRSRFYDDEDDYEPRKFKRAYEPRYEQQARRARYEDDYYYQQPTQAMHRAYQGEVCPPPPFQGGYAPPQRMMMYQQQPSMFEQPQQQRVVYQQVPTQQQPAPLPPKVIYVDEAGNEVPEPIKRPAPQQQVVKRVVVKSQPPPPGVEEPEPVKPAPPQQQPEVPAASTSTAGDYSMQVDETFMPKSRLEHFEDILKGL